MPLVEQGLDEGAATEAYPLTPYTSAQELLREVHEAMVAILCAEAPNVTAGGVEGLGDYFPKLFSSNTYQIEVRIIASKKKGWTKALRQKIANMANDKLLDILRKRGLADKGWDGYVWVFNPDAEYDDTVLASKRQQQPLL